MSVNLCQVLPGDLLHSVYGEWLGWKDLSTLDVACVEKTAREVWLTSLTDLRKTQGRFWGRLSDSSLRIFYQWLVGRKVFCVDGFIVRLNSAEDAMAVLDMESYCPTLRSVDIQSVISSGSTLDLRQVKNKMSLFLSHCHNLQEVTVNVYSQAGLIDIVLQELAEKLRENSLTKISLVGYCSYDEITMMASLLTKHASSLRDLECQFVDEEGRDFVMSTLIENQIRLRGLTIKVDCECSSFSALMSYISRAGDLLEVLDIACDDGTSVNIDDLVVLLTTFCPKLTCLYSLNDNTCSAGSLRLLYEQCQHLQDVSIQGAINARGYNESMYVSLEVKGSNDDWAVCLSHALRKRQYEEVTLRLRDEVNYHPVRNLKSMLEPYQIELYTSGHEISFISLLHDLPHLNALHMKRGFDHPWTDATLKAIIEHANSLTHLHVEDDDYQSGMQLSDKQLSELITTCQLLQSLRICCCGLESLVAVSKHSSLKDLNLLMDESVSEEMFDGLLLDEKVKWPSTLEEGLIRSCGNLFYTLNVEDRHWIKHNLMD